MLWFVLASVALGHPSSDAVERAVADRLVERIVELRVEALVLRQEADVHEALLDDGRLLEVATMLRRTSVDAILVQRTQAELEVAKRSAIYGDKHPQLGAARSQLEAVLQRLEEEVRLVIRTDRMHADALAKQEQALREAP